MNCIESSDRRILRSRTVHSSHVDTTAYEEGMRKAGGAVAVTFCHWASPEDTRHNAKLFLRYPFFEIFV